MTIQELDKNDIQLLNRFLKNRKAFMKFRKIMLEWRNKKYHVYLNKKPKQEILYNALFDTFDWNRYNREYWNEIDMLWTSIVTRIYPNERNIVNRVKEGEKDLSEAEKEKYYNIYVKKI